VKTEAVAGAVVAAVAVAVSAAAAAAAARRLAMVTGRARHAGRTSSGQRCRYVRGVIL